MREAHEILRTALRSQRPAHRKGIRCAGWIRAIDLALALLPLGLAQAARSGTAGILAASVLLAAALVLALVSLGLRARRKRLCERLAQDASTTVRARLYAHLQQLSHGFFDGDFVEKARPAFASVGELRPWIARVAVAVPAELFSIVASLLALVAVDARLALGLLPALATWPLWRAHLRWLRLPVPEDEAAEAELIAFLRERVPALGAVKACNAQTVDRARAEVCFAQLARCGESAALREARLGSLASLTRTLGLIGVASLGVWLAGRGGLEAPVLLVGIWLVFLAGEALVSLAEAAALEERTRRALAPAVELLAREPEPGWSDELQPYEGRGQLVRLHRLGYQLPGDRWILRNLTTSLLGPGLVSITADDPLAVRCFLELLLRLRRPHEGHIAIDGRHQRALRVDDLRRAIGWVDGELEVAGTVRALIGSDPGNGLRARFLRAWDAAELVAPGLSAAPWSDPAPNVPGMPSDPAARLRLALASALLHDPPILLLDEPTRELERPAAARFLAWLEECSRRKLVLIATREPAIHERSNLRLHLARPPDAAPGFLEERGLSRAEPTHA